MKFRYTGLMQMEREVYIFLLFQLLSNHFYTNL